MASTMLSAAKNGRYSSLFPSLCLFLPVFDEICGAAMDFVFFVRVTLIKIANAHLTGQLR